MLALILIGLFVLENPSNQHSLKTVDGLIVPFINYMNFARLQRKLWNLSFAVTHVITEPTIQFRICVQQIVVNEEAYLRIYFVEIEVFVLCIRFKISYYVCPVRSNIENGMKWVCSAGGQIHLKQTALSKCTVLVYMLYFFAHLYLKLRCVLGSRLEDVNNLCILCLLDRASSW